MGILELLTASILGWQVVMPAIDNGKYMVSITPQGQIIKMNTQDGSMVFCDSKTLVCPDEVKKEEPSRPIVTDPIDYR